MDTHVSLLTILFLTICVLFGKNTVWYLDVGFGVGVCLGREFFYFTSHSNPGYPTIYLQLPRSMGYNVLGGGGNK